MPLNDGFVHLHREQVLVQAYLTSKRVKGIGMIALTIKGGTRYKGKRETGPDNMYNVSVTDQISYNFIQLIIHGRARFDPLPPSRGSLVSRTFPSSALS